MADTIDDQETTFDEFRRPDEPVPVWLQRVLAEPFRGLDRQLVQEKLDEIAKTREERNKKLLEDFNAECLNLYAWASSRPSAEQQHTISAIQSKVGSANAKGEQQERLRQHLMRFAETIHDALSILMEARKPSLDTTTPNPLATLPSQEAPISPTVICPDSSPHEA